MPPATPSKAPASSAVAATIATTVPAAVTTTAAAVLSALRARLKTLLPVRGLVVADIFLRLAFALAFRARFRLSRGFRGCFRPLRQRGGRRLRRRKGRFRMGARGFVLFQVFEYVADVQEGVAVQADVHEGRLHAREHAGDPALVNASNQRELFLAFDVNLYELSFFQNRDSPFVGGCGNNQFFCHENSSGGIAASPGPAESRPVVSGAYAGHTPGDVAGRSKPEG